MLATRGMATCADELFPNVLVRTIAHTDWHDSFMNSVNKYHCDDVFSFAHICTLSVALRDGTSIHLCVDGQILLRTIGNK